MGSNPSWVGLARQSNLNIPNISQSGAKPIRISDKSYYELMRGKGGLWQSPLREESVKNKTKVWAAVVVDSLENIDAIKSTFELRMKMFLVWETDLRCTHLEQDTSWQMMLDHAKESRGPYRLKDDECKLFKDNIRWPKSLVITNKITGLDQEETFFEILDPKTVKKRNKNKIWMKSFDGLVCCREVQELDNFPFDVQHLHLDFLLSSREDQDTFDLMIHTIEYNASALETPAWTLFSPRIDAQRDDKITSVRFTVVRNSTYFIWSVVVPVLLFSIVCIAAFAIPVGYEEDDIGDGIVDRLSITVTMILTSVAFKFIIGEELPKISYWTMLDKFVWHHFIFVFLLTMHFAVGPYWVRNADTDHTVMYLMVTLLILITACWVFQAIVLVKARNALLPEQAELKPINPTAVSYRYKDVPHIKVDNGVRVTSQSCPPSFSSNLRRIKSEGYKPPQPRGGDNKLGETLEEKRKEVKSCMILPSTKKVSDHPLAREVSDDMMELIGSPKKKFRPRTNAKHKGTLLIQANAKNKGNFVE